MIINYFFLSAGLSGIVFPVGHAFWVQKHIMGEVEETEMQKATKRSIFAFLHYTTSMVFLSAVALITASTFSNASAAQPLAWFIVAINAGNLFVAIGAILMRDREALGQAIPAFIVMVIWIGVIVAGIIV